jgi:hypothetical protein
MFKKIIWLGFSSKWKRAKDVSKYIKSLVDSWAWEFFTWYNPDYWYEKFGFEVSPNGRFAEHEQITDFWTLKLVVEEVHNHKIEIFWNINSWYYTDETFPLIEKMIKQFEEVWIDWIICWNIWVLEYLKKIWYKWKINISTILAIYNSEAIKFLLENYDINKIILSREITLKEIEELVTDFPDTIFEVFWEWDFCRYNNGLCFAEHKYWDKDICTVVVNDLIFKKKFRVDFKELILDEQKDNFEKIEILDDTYKDEFEEIEEILLTLTWILFLENDNKESQEEKLYKLVDLLKNRVDLFFDAMQWINSIRNAKILTYLKALKYLNKHEFNDLRVEIEDSIQSWIKCLITQSKELWWIPKLKALEIWNFYARWDNLNLYSYLFFTKFKNIDTVKFPTRWRNYNEKIKLIEDTVNSKKVDKSLITRASSIERAHYDLTYLFWNKLWFRKMIKENVHSDRF